MRECKHIHRFYFIRFKRKYGLWLYVRVCEPMYIKSNLLYFESDNWHCVLRRLLVLGCQCLPDDMPATFLLANPGLRFVFKFTREVSF